MTRRAYLGILAVLIVLLSLAILASLGMGAVRLRLSETIQVLLSLFTGRKEGIATTIVLDLRLARTLLAAAVGVSLAVSGTAFQGFFRNPLADPYVIGASSGAALGAALAIVFGAPQFSAFSTPALAAFVGALAAVGLAFFVSRVAGDPPPAAALLLAGTALSSLFSAALSLVLVVKDKDMARVYYWLLGGFGGTGWSDLIAVGPVMLLGCLIVTVASRPLDLLSFGEEQAGSLGLDVKRSRAIIAAGASLAAAAAVSAAGIIGFVGLVAPHAARLIVGPSHKRLIPAAALTGALLVVLSDVVARTAASPLELPVGIVTSAVGAPFFLYLLARKAKGLGRS